MITKVVQDASPDILGLLETVGWGENNQAQLKSFSQEVNLPHAFFGKANTKYDMALLSGKAPLKTDHLADNLWHTAIQSIYQVPSLGEIAIFLVHLNPHFEDKRLNEFRYILSLTRQFKHAILVGDFNSLSPHDPYDKEALLAIFQKQGLEKFGTAALRFDCMQLLEKEGFVDTFQKPFRATVPTPVSTDKAHAAPLRLDYIFVSSELAPLLSGAEIIYNSRTAQTSDHYPIIADFKFDIE